MSRALRHRAKTLLGKTVRVLFTKQTGTVIEVQGIVVTVLLSADGLTHTIIASHVQEIEEEIPT